MTIENNYKVFFMHPGKRLVVLVALTASLHTSAQSTDTLAMARDLANQRKFPEASVILRKYNQHRPTKDGYWFEAQLAYWMKDTDRAGKLYRNLVAQYPDDRSLALDYGKFLFETGHYQQAGKILKEILQKDPREATANKMMAYMDYWQGNSVSAVKRSDLILLQDSSNAEIRKLRNDAAVYGAPRIHTDVIYSSDDQALQSTWLQGGIGLARSKFLAPELAFQLASFNSSTEKTLSATTGHFELVNNLRFWHGKTQMKIRAGAYIHPDANFFTGHIQLKQQLTRTIHFEGQWGQLPYQYTLASIRDPFVFRSGSAALGFEKGKWMGQLAYYNQSFDDGNKVDVLSAWFLAPVISKKKWSLQAGYAFSYSDAAQNTFQPKDSMDVIVDKHSLYDQVEGVYDPYFTPTNQYVHYLIALVKADLSSRFSFQAKFNYGVYAKADNPYLMLDRKATQFFVSKSYGELQYTPMEAEAKLNFNTSANTSLAATYTFNKLFFYTRHQVQMGLKHRFGK
jgi:Tfp pilus assembly protein PilF